MYLQATVPITTTTTHTSMRVRVVGNSATQLAPNGREKEAALGSPYQNRFVLTVLYLLPLLCSTHVTWDGSNVLPLAHVWDGSNVSCRQLGMGKIMERDGKRALSRNRECTAEFSEFTWVHAAVNALGLRACAFTGVYTAM